MRKEDLRQKRVLVQSVVESEHPREMAATVLEFLDEDTVVLAVDDGNRVRKGGFSIETGGCVRGTKVGDPCFDPTGVRVLTDKGHIRAWRDGRVLSYTGSNRLLPFRDALWAKIEGERLGRGFVLGSEAFAVWQGMDVELSKTVWNAFCEQVRFPDNADADMMLTPVERLIHPTKNEVLDVAAHRRHVRISFSKEAKEDGQRVLVDMLVQKLSTELLQDLDPLRMDPEMRNGYAGRGLLLAMYWPLVVVPEENLNRWTVRLRYAKVMWEGLPE